MKDALRAGLGRWRAKAYAKGYHTRRRKRKVAAARKRRVRKGAMGIVERQIRKGWRHRGVELSHATGLGYGVEEAASSMMTVRVLAAVVAG